MSDQALDLIAYAVVAGPFVYLIFLIWNLFARPSQRRRAPSLVPRTHIIVDGSNVMHWGGAPSVLVLARVLGALKEKDLTPIVYFDANVGYKLWESYASSQKMASRLMLANSQVIVVAKGVVADEVLLQAAVDNGLRVVTNDRFLDWRAQFPQTGKKRFLVKGTWKQGSVMLRGL